MIAAVIIAVLAFIIGFVAGIVAVFWLLQRNNGIVRLSAGDLIWLEKEDIDE